MDPWLTVAVRSVPFVLTGLLVLSLPTLLERENGQERFRRMLVVEALFACTAAMFVGGLARAGVISGDAASLIYTIVGVGISIVAATLLWVYVIHPWFDRRRQS